MRDVLPAIRAKGAELIVVGSGKPWHAKAFRDELALEFPLYVDPELIAYRAAGLKRSFWRTLGPQNLAGAIKAWSHGQRQHANRGDPWQQGGVFVIGKDGETRLSHINRGSADHADPAKVVAALA